MQMLFMLRNIQRTLNIVREATTNAISIIHNHVQQIAIFKANTQTRINIATDAQRHSRARRGAPQGSAGRYLKFLPR